MGTSRGKDGLTDMQRAFVEAFDGDATAAVVAAGYRGNNAQQRGNQLRWDPAVDAAIRERRASSPEARARIATREERQAFWTATMLDTAEAMTNRLKASELLGKSEADFTDKLKHEGGLLIRVGDPYEKRGDD